LPSINSSNSSGKSAICRDRKPLIAHTSIRRSSAADCSLRSAKYDERVPIASNTRSTRCTTLAGSGCRAAAFSKRPTMACSRRRPASSNRRYEAACR